MRRRVLEYSPDDTRAGLQSLRCHKSKSCAPVKICQKQKAQVHQGEGERSASARQALMNAPAAKYKHQDKQ
jgi:hypothetical protein